MSLSLLRGPFFNKGYRKVIAKVIAKFEHFDDQERKGKRNVEQKGYLKNKRRKEGRIKKRKRRKKKGQIKHQRN